MLAIACGLLLLADSNAVPVAASPAPDDPRTTVVLLGGTMIEREQEYGHWEAALRTGHPQTRWSVRNLGWSGDTVWAESRGRFDPPGKAYPRMVATVKSLRPNVVVFGYGRAEAMAAFHELADLEPRFAQAALADAAARFERRFHQLVRDLPTEQRVFLGLPTLGEQRSEAVAVPWAEVRDAFDETVRAVASRSDGRFVSLDDRAFADAPLTDDGVQWNDAGYARSAPRWADGVAAAVRSNGNDREQQLGAAKPLADDQHDRVLDAIRRKNRLVFHRFRPQNTTYLLLFRKHEQGQNAGEIPQFDPAIAAADRAIDSLIADAAD